MEALLWILHVAEGVGDVVMCCDSHYVMGIADGLINPAANLEAVMCFRTLLRQVRAVRAMTFVHMKGHSSDAGNDRADELAWWGKEEGPYSRIATDGSGEGAGRHRPAPQTLNTVAPEMVCQPCATAQRGPTLGARGRC